MLEEMITAELTEIGLKAKDSLSLRWCGSCIDLLQDSCSSEWRTCAGVPSCPPPARCYSDQHGINAPTGKGGWLWCRYQFQLWRNFSHVTPGKIWSWMLVQGVSGWILRSLSRMWRIPQNNQTHLLSRPFFTSHYRLETLQGYIVQAPLWSGES